MRLVVARCEVHYTGRLTAVLPEAVRLLVFKADGSVLVHDDAGGYKPLNWMTPPTVVEEHDSSHKRAALPVHIPIPLQADGAGPNQVKPNSHRV